MLDERYLNMSSSVNKGIIIVIIIIIINHVQLLNITPPQCFCGQSSPKWDVFIKICQETEASNTQKLQTHI